MVQKMDKKLKISFSHPIREQLAQIAIGLKDFELSFQSRALIITNKNSWKVKSPTVIEVFSKLLNIFKKTLQLKLGLINFKFYRDAQADLYLANGGFLISDKPYVVYAEKSTQLYGYTGKNYNKFLSKKMLKFFLKDQNLKYIFFRTKTGRQGMANIPYFDKKIKKLLKEKSVSIYPPLSNPGKVTLQRFRQKNKIIKFLFVSSIFYEKGGKELLNAFNKLSKEVNDVQLTIITKISKLSNEELTKIKSNKKIILLDANFSRKELFLNFFNKAHIFIYPTYSDSFAAVINEAISSYLPIITSDFFSIPERVINGYNGFLFKSPFPNYDENMVIYKEHFTKNSFFPDVLFYKDNKIFLFNVENFLYSKMKLLATNKKLLHKMAKNSKKIYKKNMNPVKIREDINNLFLKAVGKNKNAVL